MLEDYVDQFYIPAAYTYKEIQRGEGKEAEMFASWKRNIREKWHEVGIEKVETMNGEEEAQVGTAYTVTARVRLGTLRPEDVEVELYYGPLGPQDEIEHAATEKMHCVSNADEVPAMFKGTLSFQETGKLGYAVRILPKHALLVHPVDMGLVIWG